MIRKPECSGNNPQCVKNTLSFQLFLTVFFINLNAALALLVLLEGYIRVISSLLSNYV